jgi:MFS family permease
LARLPFYYGWVIVVVAALAMTATLPGRTHGLGLIAEPLKADLKLTGVQFTWLNFWAILLGAALCLPTGRLIDRLGARIVLTAVALALGGAVLAMSQVEDELPFFVTLTLVRGLGQGALSVVSMAIIGKWFTRRLGPAMAVFTVLLGPGFFVGISFLSSGVQDYGWRAAWSGLALVLVFGMAPLGWLLARSTPEKLGLSVEQPAEAPDKPPAAGVGMTLAQALRTPTFWVFTLAASWFGLAWSAVTLANEAILKDQGFGEPGIYGQVMAVLGASGLPSNLVGGWLARRYSMGRLLGGGMLAFAGSLLFFPSIHTMGAVYAYALLLGVAGGLITVVFFVVYGHAFGRAHLGYIQGAAQVLTVVASASGPLVLEGCKAWQGSYHLFFYGAGIVALILALWGWFVHPRPTARIGPEDRSKA